MSAKASIDKALQHEKDVPREVLLTKIKFLENELQSLGKIIGDKGSFVSSDLNKSNMSHLYNQLRQLNTESIDERVRLTEKIKSLEKELRQTQEDYHYML